MELVGYRPLIFLTGPIITIFLWILALISPGMGTILVENGVFTPGAADPLFTLPASNGLGLSAANVLVISGISLPIAGFLWVVTEDEFDDIGVEAPVQVPAGGDGSVVGFASHVPAQDKPNPRKDGNDVVED